MNYRDVSNQKEIIEIYWDRFKNGKVHNFYLDKYRYNSADTWASREDWLSIAKECIKTNRNILSALEILLKEEYSNYRKLADEILVEWYTHGGYDIEYYQDILLMMPKDYELRKEIFDEEYFAELSSDFLDREMARSILRSEDLDFYQRYAKLVNHYIEKHKYNYEELEFLLEYGCMVEFGKHIDSYIDGENIKILRKMVVDYLEEDKNMFLKMRDGYIPDEEERSLWIVDNVAKIVYYLGWHDILDDLILQQWYWDVLFDSEMDLDYENINLLVLSSYTSNDTLKNRAYALISNRFFDDSMDAVIALSRLNKTEHSS